MPFVRAVQICRETPIARLDDPIGLVAENLRESHYGAIPVIEGELEENGKPGPRSRMLGVIFERDISAVVIAAVQGRRHQFAPLRPDVSSSQPSASHSAPVPPAATVRPPVTTFPGVPQTVETPPGLQTAEERIPAAAVSVEPPLPVVFDTASSTALPSRSTYESAGRLLEREQAEAIGTAGGSNNPGAANASGINNGVAGESVPKRAVTDLTARDAVRRDAGFIAADSSLPNVLLMLDHFGVDALPVVDEEGNYRGMISRADAVAALGGQVRPPSVGGMATPLGVWLTTGNVSAGVPPLGLALAGFFMFVCLSLAHVILLMGLSAINPEYGAMFRSGQLGIASDSSNFFNLIVTVAEGLLFLLLIRLTPVAGYHAAEHQTVWAIERGLPLTPENVGKMPRAHPRCGTNLVALAGLIKILLGHLPAVTPVNVLLALLFVYFFWRNFGTALQQYLTTRPASLRQLESGIRAGKELLAKFQDQPHVEVSFGKRLWNSGIAFAAVGMIGGAWIFGIFLDWMVNWVLR